MLKRACFLLLLIATPLLQVLVHAVKGTALVSSLGLVIEHKAPTHSKLGILVNERDNMSYAAWAEQARLGHYLASDLYTTDTHIAVMFNPYFIITGISSRISSIPPFLVMVLESIVASGFFGYVVYRIARQAGLPEAPSAAAVFVTLFCSGPSWLLFLFYSAFPNYATTRIPFLGIDGFYFDIFPVTIFIAYPFASFNLLVVAATVLLITRSLSSTKLTWGCLLLAALACVFALLVRPYDALILSVLFLASIYGHEAIKLQHLGFDRHRFVACLAPSLLVLPACLYIYLVAQLPVWRDFAQSSVATGPTRIQMAVGFSVLWLLAACGTLRAVKEKNTKLTFLIIWSGIVTAGILILGPGMARFSSGVVVPYSILAVYGLENLYRSQLAQAKRLFGMASALLVSTLLTSASGYASILIQRLPTVGKNIEDAGLEIRRESGKALPTVLTDCSTAIFLPGIAGVRVFAGHWSLTPGYKAKCGLLELAGLANVAGTYPFNPAELDRLIQNVNPNYILIRTGTPAEQHILSTHPTFVTKHIGDWSIFSTKMPYILGGRQ